MKIINPKFTTLSFLFLIVIAVIFFFIYLCLFSSNEVQSSFNYVVEQGEICSDIAGTFGVSTVSIVKLNKLQSDCSDIYPGQVLLIPYPTPTITPLGFIFVSPTSFGYIDCDRVLYTVEEGDTLESVSRKYAVPAETIINYNGIVDEKIALFPGNELLIPLCFRAADTINPSSTPEPIYDVFPVRCEIVLEVLEGDVLDAIAANYMVSKEDIIKYNHMKSDEISPDMKLIIPMCNNMPTPTVTPGK